MRTCVCVCVCARARARARVGRQENDAKLTRARNKARKERDAIHQKENEIAK